MLRVRDVLDRDHADELDIARLARMVSLSPDHLIRSFAAVFGESPHRYLQRRRVERAMFLLRTTTLSVTEICAQVGCVDPASRSSRRAGRVSRQW